MISPPPHPRRLLLLSVAVTLRQRRLLPLSWRRLLCPLHADTVSPAQAFQEKAKTATEAARGNEQDDGNLNQHHKSYAVKAVRTMGYSPVHIRK